MKNAQHRHLVERMGDLARDAEMPSIDISKQRNMVQRAVRAAHMKTTPSPWGRAWPMYASAAIAFAACMMVLFRSGVEPAPAAHSEVMKMSLPTGDILTIEPGAKFELASATTQNRAVMLRSGAMLFDVRHLDGDQAFSVRTSDVVVTVRGTVFSVEKARGETVVHVYEGRVAITQRGHSVKELAANEDWSSTGRGEMTRDATGPLEREAHAAVVRRERIARAASPAALPVVPNQVAVVAPAPNSELPQDPFAPTVDDQRARPVSPRPAIAAPSIPEVRTPHDAAQLIASGEFLRALALADAALATSSQERGAWLLMRAKALRGLRRFSDSVQSYEDAAKELSNSQAQLAEFEAASIRFEEMADPNGALQALDRGHVDAQHSPLEERALALRARAFVQLGREADARAVAARYIAAFPDTALRTWMDAVLAE